MNSDAPGRDFSASQSGGATISVVIPTRDTCELTVDCLRSLRATAFAPLDVVVVDDGGHDHTLELIGREFASVRCSRLETSHGFSSAANAGLALATGELLLLLNSDTQVQPEALAALEQAFAADPGLGIVGASLLNPDGTPQWSGGMEPSLTWLFVMASGLAMALGSWPSWRRMLPPSGHRRGQVEWVSGAAMAMRRRVWHEVGPLDDSFRLYGQDLDLCCRARDAGWRVTIEPSFRVVHVGGATVLRDVESGTRRHSLTLLWADLMTWAARRRGPAWAKLCRRALRLGSRLAMARHAVAARITTGPTRRQHQIWQEALRHAVSHLDEVCG